MLSAEALRPLPKAELHLHLDGSVRPETAVELAGAIAMPLDLEEARRRLVGPERCDSQAQLLQYFDLPIALLQTADALERVTAELVDDLVTDGVRYAEVRWAPRLHLERGLSVTAVLEAVAAGVARAAAAHGAAMPLVGLIVTAMRSHPPAANVELARTAAAFGPPILGFDLAGLEAEWPAPPHAAAFNAAREGGLALTAHAGEVAGPQRVREVLDFGISRVAHGVTAVDDDALLQLLRARDITLDLCPTSNVQAGIVADLSSHPIAALHRAGVKRDPVDRRPHGHRDLALRGDGEDRERRRAHERRARSDRAQRLRAAHSRHLSRWPRSAPERRGRGTPGAMGPASAETSLEQGQHRRRVRGDRVGAPFAVERGRQRRVRDAGQDQDGRAARAVRPDDVGIGVVADDDRVRGGHVRGLEDGLEHGRATACRSPPARPRSRWRGPPRSRRHPAGTPPPSDTARPHWWR